MDSEEIVDSSSKELIAQASVYPQKLARWKTELPGIYPDVDKGKASGESFGNAFNWHYLTDFPVGKSSYKVKFDYWIWAFDENTIMKRSCITKFGITFAEVTILYAKTTILNQTRK